MIFSYISCDLYYYENAFKVSGEDWNRESNVLYTLLCSRVCQG